MATRIRSKIGPNWLNRLSTFCRKEARTRDIPSPSFDGFGFIVFYCAVFIRLVGGIFLIVNLITGVRNVRFRPKADVRVARICSDYVNHPAI